jgi:exopolyphosphatase/pppGpp-phosphohydrolase
MIPANDAARIRNFIRRRSEPHVAIFEIGTRAARVLIAPKLVPAHWVAGTFTNDSILTNLGFDVGFSDLHLPLDSRALAATIEFINTRASFLRDLGIYEVSVLGTAWLRWLTNAEAVLHHVEQSTGYRIELIQQEREAELIISSLPEVLRRTNTVGQISPDDLLFAIDQGGGSLQVTWMQWGQTDETRPYIDKRQFERLGTVALRQEFFYNDAKGRQIKPQNNRTRIFAQIDRIQADARRELSISWRERNTLLRRSSQRYAYAVGSAITNVFPQRQAHIIHDSIIAIPAIETALRSIAGYYDTLANPVLTIYKKLTGAKGAGVDSIAKTSAEIDKDLVQIYGLPIYIELMQALALPQLRILGYPLRFGYYIWKYLHLEPESTVRADRSAPYLFVSYARSDKALVYDQLATLDAMGYRVWWDEGLIAGQDFEPQLSEAILGSRAVIWCLTPAAVASDFVTKEVRFAARQGIRVIPIEIRKVVMPSDLDLILGSPHRLPRFRLREDRYRSELHRVLPAECVRR